MSEQRWQQVWERKGLEGLAGADGPAEDTLTRMLSINGYSSGLVAPAVADWTWYVGEIARRLGISPDDSVYEVGCGCGAFLYPLAQLGCRTAGMDYSPNLIEVAQRVLPAGSFRVGEANGIDADEKFDFVLSCGVFIYFPGLEYARETLEKMLAKSVRALAVLDVNDRELREHALELRRASFPPGEYDARYEGLDQLYFEKSWFATFAEEQGLRCVIEPQFLPRSTNSRYRFNVYMFK